MNFFKIIMLTPLFILLLAVILHSIRSAYNFGRMYSFILSACISMLAMIGINQCLDGSFKVILLPYAVLGISTILILIFLFITRNHDNERQKK